MAMHFSVRAMNERIKTRFFVPMLFSILTFAVAITTIWLPEGESKPVAEGFVRAFCCGLFFSVPGTLLAEARQKPQLRSLYASLGIAAGIGLYILCDNLNPYDSAFFALPLVAALVCCALFSRGSNPEGDLSRMLGCVLVCVGVSILIMLILLLLSSVILALFAPEIRGSGTYGYPESTSAAVSGLLAAPYLLFAHLPGSNAPGEKYTGLRKILAYVILPAYLVLLSILLGYILLILIRWELPVGQLNPCALLALGTFALLHLLLKGDENRLARFFRKWGAWMLPPVIIAQALAVYVRVSAYGLTEARIGGLVITISCLIPLAAALMKKKSHCVFFPVCAVLLLTLAATPLNAGTLARWDQESRLYGALARAGMLDDSGLIIRNEDAPERERRIIWSSASYLDDRSYGIPPSSRAAELLRQLDATAAEGDVSSFGEKAGQLFGFGNPSPVYFSRTKLAKGVSDTDELSVAGFSYARLFRVYFRESSQWRAELEDETVTLDMILPYADFESETMTEPDIPLPGGRTLRINSLECVEYPDGIYYMLSAWLMTP